MAKPNYEKATQYLQTLPSDVREEALRYVQNAYIPINDLEIALAAERITTERAAQQKVVDDKAARTAVVVATRKANQTIADENWARFFERFPQVARTKEHIAAIHKYVRANTYDSIVQAFDQAASNGEVVLDGAAIGITGKFKGPEGLGSDQWLRLTSPVHKVDNLFIPGGKNKGGTFEDRGAKPKTGSDPYGRGAHVPSLVESEAYNWTPTLAAKVQAMSALDQKEYFARHPEHRKTADGEQKSREVSREDAVQFLKAQGITSVTPEQITKTMLALAKKL